MPRGSCRRSDQARNAARIPNTRVPRESRRHKGQALVEFALVAPVLFLMFFGVVEFSLINASIGTFNFAAKDAARLGSLLGRSDPNADTEMVTLIRSRVSGLVVAQTTKIEIFKSDPSGAINTASEDDYDINGNPIGSPTWPVDLRNDTLTNADFLGVRISYTYTYLTAMLAGGTAQLNLTSISVQRIEPQDYLGAVPASPRLAARPPHGAITTASTARGDSTEKHSPDDTVVDSMPAWRQRGGVV